MTACTPGCIHSHLRIWPREVNVESLYRSGPSPLHTQIAVERDPTSGELLGYHEVRTYVSASTS